MAGQEQISLQRSLGLRFLQLLIVLLAFALVRNCIIISTNRNIPGLKMELEYYEKGVNAGKQKALNGSSQAQPHFSHDDFLAQPVRELKGRVGAEIPARF